MKKILIERNLMVPMRDGVKLATDVYSLGVTPTPVLVVRTPYNKEHLTDSTEVFDIMRAVRAGYTVVAQDVRGRFASEGVFNPHLQETLDGLDCFAWAAAQPWSNGIIGTFGGSYLGATQWLPAREQPPALRAMAPSITFSDSYEGCMYQGGAKVLHDLRWVVASIVPAEIERRLTQGETPIASNLSFDVDGALSEIPLSSHPFIKEYAGFYLDWLVHATADDYWQASAPNAGYESILVPALNISGWYDIFLWSTFENYLGMKQRGGSDVARKNQRLIIGPWSHMNFSGIFPERNFGEGSSSQSIDLAGIHLCWFDRWLKDVDHQKAEPPVLIFVMGTNQWRSESDWPLPDMQYRSYYLHSQGQANSLRGDGSLSEQMPKDEPCDVYHYNPLNPVPTIGGQVILPGDNAIGPRDQRDVELRDDVLVYSTAPLEYPLEVTGPIELRLFVSSSALDTDFTGKLVDVFPDGRAIILTEGILRARYRNSFTEPELLEAEKIYELRLNLWATSNVFLPGHRIRLEVSSSNFPRFNRNSNTGGTIHTEPSENYQVAINRIFHDSAHPSHVLLPIIER